MMELTYAKRSPLLWFPLEFYPPVASVMQHLGSYFSLVLQICGPHITRKRVMYN